MHNSNIQHEHENTTTRKVPEISQPQRRTKLSHSVSTSVNPKLQTRQQENEAAVKPSGTSTLARSPVVAASSIKNQSPRFTQSFRPSKSAPLPYGCKISHDLQLKRSVEAVAPLSELC